MTETGTPTEYRFNHIKVDPKLMININYDENSQGGWTNHNLRPPQLAMESFYEALRLFRPAIAQRIQLTPNGLNALQVVEVHFEHLKKGEEFIKLVATQDMAETEGRAQHKLPRLMPQGELKEATERLEEEAIQFINGARGQLMLPLESASDDEDEDESGDLFDDEDEADDDDAEAASGEELDDAAG